MTIAVVESRFRQLEIRIVGVDGGFRIKPSTSLDNFESFPFTLRVRLGGTSLCAVMPIDYSKEHHWFPGIQVIPETGVIHVRLARGFHSALVPLHARGIAITVKY